MQRKVGIAILALLSFVVLSNDCLEVPNVNGFTRSCVGIFYRIEDAGDFNVYSTVANPTYADCWMFPFGWSWRTTAGPFDGFQQANPSSHLYGYGLGYISNSLVTEVECPYESVPNPTNRPTSLDEQQSEILYDSPYNGEGWVWQHWTNSRCNGGINAECDTLEECLEIAAADDSAHGVMYSYGCSCFTCVDGCAWTYYVMDCMQDEYDYEIYDWPYHDMGTHPAEIASYEHETQVWLKLYDEDNSSGGGDVGGTEGEEVATFSTSFPTGRPTAIPTLLPTNLPTEPPIGQSSGDTGGTTGFVVTSGHQYCEVDENGCVHDGSNSYANHEDCAFEFRGDAILVATDFDIENNSSCAWDWLQVDGRGKFCGSEFPAMLVSGVTKFSFHTDYSVTRRGFHICAESWNK